MPRRKLTCCHPLLCKILPHGIQLKIKCLALEEKRISAVSLDPIPCAEFLYLYRKLLKQELIPVQFKALGRLDIDYSQLIASLPCNILKNCTKHVLPYDHSRVCLDTAPNMVDMDYINANFIYRMAANKKVKAYIAAQGPLAVTIADFWRMVWQEGVNTIVMLTNIFSYSKQECEKYWHNIYSMYGDIHVRQDSVSTTCHFTIRKFTISKVGVQRERAVLHFQFHTWIEQEIPDIPALLDFQRKVKFWYNSSCSKGPILVHCGNGAGRTGAYIALDIVLDNIRERGEVDILSTISSIRKFRPQLVNHASQLKLIYDAVAYLMTCGITAIPVGKLNSVVQQMGHQDMATKLTGYEREYRTLLEVIPALSIGDCAGGHRAENRRKSRDVMIQPPERARPYLMTFDSSDSSDFINAVYIDGYNATNEYIITQWPIKKTSNDIWRLIFDTHTSSVVILHDDATSRSFPCFWPTTLDVKERFGPIYSTLTKACQGQILIIKQFTIKKALINPTDMSAFGSESRQVQFIFVKGWPDSNKVPLQNYILLDAILAADEWKKDQNTTKTPTLVISKNGVSRAGIFCTLSICLDKIKHEGELDVFNAARTVLINRPQLLDSLAEYTYVYTFLLNTMDSMEICLSSVILPLVLDKELPNHYRQYSSQRKNRKPKKKHELLNIKLPRMAIHNNNNSRSPDDLLLLKANSKEKKHRRENNSESGKNSEKLSGVENTITDGKTFLHYATSQRESAQKPKTILKDVDTVSYTSSFVMDSDIISLENAEFTSQPHINYPVQTSELIVYKSENTLL